MPHHAPQSLVVAGFMRKSPSCGAMSCFLAPDSIMNAGKGKYKGKKLLMTVAIGLRDDKW